MFGSITSWEGDLFDQFNRLQREIDDIFGTPNRPASIRAVARGSYPAINVGTTADGVDVYVFAAGIDQEQLELSIQQNLLTISGVCKPVQPEGSKAYLHERFSGNFQRSLSLPEDIDPDSASAKYSNGVLHISLRRKAEAQPRKIQVN
jgi:HSP20 family protein